MRRILLSLSVALLGVLAVFAGTVVAQTPPSGFTAVFAPFAKSFQGPEPLITADLVGGCTDQSATGACDDILGDSLDATLQEVNLDVVNARQAIQLNSGDIITTEAKAVSALAKANTAETTATAAESTANTAQTAANAAHTAATAAQTTANTANTTADANAIKIGTPDPRFSSLEDELVNARQGIQIATNDAADADTKAVAAQATADTKRTAPQVQTAIDISLASFQEPGGNIVDGSIAEIKFTPAVIAKLDAEAPEYRPGIAPYKFAGSTRTAAVFARDEYFLGEVDLSQAYVSIFSAGNASRIRVTLDASIPAQVGTAGNSWNLVLGQSNPNTNVTISPDTPKMTFTLGLPAAGITLDTLAGDLDNNTRLSAEVVGNGSSLVNLTATWGPNPTTGSRSPFGNGGNASTTPRIGWRSAYIANDELVIVLDYADLEEYQHWETDVADWTTVLILVDPPLPILSAGSSVNFFSGGSRTQAVAARDLYSLQNTGVVQASRLLPLGTSTTAGVLVTLSADNAIGAVWQHLDFNREWGRLCRFKCRYWCRCS